MNKNSQDYEPLSKMRRNMSFDHDSSCQMTIDNSDSLLRTVKNMYHEKLWCDVLLKVGGKTHAAHRLFLCASSDVFQAMLMKPEWSEWHESEIELQELPQCEAVFHNFLEYFYTGKIIITHTTVLGILCLADKYIVKSLTHACTEYLYNHVHHAAAHNVLFSWLQYTMASGYKEVAERCINYIKWNLETVANLSEFTDFEPDIFINLLKQNDLVVHNEMVLFNLVTRWLDLQKIHLQQSGLPRSEVSTRMKSLLEVVMSLIRFPMMTPRDLTDLLLSPLIKENKEFFIDRMTMGMIFHYSQIDRLKSLCRTEEGRLLITPRLYTCDSFSATLIIDNVLSLPTYHMSTFVFSSLKTAAHYVDEKIHEWEVVLYPKGVWFKKCFMIFPQGTLEVPEEIMSTTRLALTYRGDIEERKEVKVRIGILLYAKQGGTEHVARVVEKIHYFTNHNRACNFDNILPFEAFSPSAQLLGHTSSVYLTGPSNNQLKINIVITPVCPEYGVDLNATHSEDPYTLIDK